MHLRKRDVESIIQLKGLERRANTAFNKAHPTRSIPGCPGFACLADVQEPTRATKEGRQLLEATDCLEAYLRSLSLPAMQELLALAYFGRYLHYRQSKRALTEKFRRDEFKASLMNARKACPSAKNIPDFAEYLGTKNLLAEWLRSARESVADFYPLAV